MMHCVASGVLLARGRQRFFVADSLLAPNGQSALRWDDKLQNRDARSGSSVKPALKLSRMPPKKLAVPTTDRLNVGDSTSCPMQEQEAVSPMAL